MDLINIIVIISAIINLILGVFIYYKGSNKLTNRSYGYLAASLFLWAIAKVMYRAVSTVEASIFLDKVLYVIPIFVVFSVLYFTFIFPEGKKPRKILIRLLFIISLLMTSLVLFSNKIIYSVVLRVGQEKEMIYGNLYSIYSLYIFGFFVWSWVIMLIKVRKSKGAIKIQSLIVFIGIFASSFLSMITNILLLKLGNFRFVWAGHIITMIMVIFIAYAILRYRLMDITVIIRKTTVYFFTIISYLSILLLAIYITAKIGDINVHWTIVWMAFFVGAILLALFDIIKLFFTNLSNKYFFSDIVDYQQTITDLAKKLPNEIRLDKVVNLIIKTLMDAMKLNRAGVLLLDSKTLDYKITKTIGFNEKNGISLITKTFLVNYLKNHKQLVATQELEFLKEAAKTKKEGVELEKLAKDMNHIEAGLCLPLFSADNLIGIIVLGNKISNDAYSKEDLEMLEIVANQAAIAIENALLYKEVEDFNKNLQKKVDEQTKDIKDKTKKLHKLLAMRSEFLNITSHQLRTPVSVIKGVLSMIKEGSIPKEKEKKFLDSAFQRTVKLNEIINDILDASAIDSGKFEIRLSPVAIEPILKKIYQDKNQDNLDLNKKIKLILDLPKKSLPAVLSNEKYLKHILINLINNAFQYTIKGSIAIKAESKKDKVIIKIIDTGIGIDKDDIPKLFQKFGRAKNAISTYTDGSGLGLFIIKKIVDEHKGAKVYIEKTELNKGSVFVLELAIAKS